MVPEISVSATRLLAVPDPHGGTLAEFDFFADQQLLYVRWHGHLTAGSVVHAAQAGQQLHASVPVRCILNDKSGTSGSWDEALPWFHYDWLPQATAGGLEALAYVLSPDLSAQPAAEEFLRIVRQQVAMKLFRQPLAAWHWLTRL
ncbi:MAG: hypothetical protein ACRYFK_01315 [Janthinobacterium lividum]